MEAQFTRDFLKHEESVRYKAYKDAVGKWTTGVGHLIDLKNEHSLLADTLTDQAVNDLLDKDILRYSPTIDKYVKVPLNLYQRTALISFAFNEGSEALRTSHLLQKINSKASEAEIRTEFLKWDKATNEKGQLIVLSGLYKRRMDEAQLYFTK